MFKRRAIVIWIVLVTLLMQSFSLTTVLADDVESREGLVFNPNRQNSVELEQPLANVPATFEMIAKFDPDPGVRQILFGNYSTPTGHTEPSYSIELTASNTLRYFEASNESDSSDRIIHKSIVSNANVTTGEWVHIAATRDAANGTVTIMVDGEIVHTADGLYLPAELSMTNPHSIGTDLRGSMYLAAEVKEVRLWNEVRTLEQLRDNANTELEGNEAGLMHLWELDKVDFSDETYEVPDKTGNINGMAKGFLPPYQNDDDFPSEGVNFADGQPDLATDMMEESPRTVEAWVNVPEDTPASQRVGVILGNYWVGSYSDIPEFSFEVYSNGTPRIYWKGIKDNILDYRANGVNINRGDWVHVAIVLDEENNRGITYINGVRVHDAVLRTNANMQKLLPSKAGALAGLKIGSDYRYEDDGTPTMAFGGEIADVRVWSTVRTEEEIKNNYNTFLTENETGLIGNWKLDEMVADVYPDNSAQQNDAYLYDDVAHNWMPADFPEGDYRIAVIPDTQYMSQHSGMMQEYFQWMRDNAEALDIELVVGVGDIVEVPGAINEWQEAQAAYTLLDGVIPYVLQVGNHDVEARPGNVRDYTNFNNHFPYEKYSQEPTFGGAMVEGEMENTYHFFELGDVEYMVLSLEFAPTANVLEWANEVVADHPDKKVIMTTHTYMYHNGEFISTDHHHSNRHYFSDAMDGPEIWEEFVSQHDNIVLAVSGHIGYPDIVVREDIGVNENVVQNVLANAQFLQPTDLGMIMMMTFTEGSNDVKVNWYSVKNDMFYRERNQFTMPLNLYENPTPPKDEDKDEDKDKDQDQDRDQDQGGGSGGGSGGGGGGSSRPPADSTPPPSDQEPGDGSEPGNGEENDFGVEVGFDRNEVDEVTVEREGETVAIKVEAAPTTENIHLSLDTNSLNQIVQAGHSVVVQTPLGDMTIDAETVAQLAGRELSIEIGQAAQVNGQPVRTVNLLSDGEEVTDFTGKVTVTVPYEQAAANGLVVYQVTDEGRVIVPLSRVVDGQIVFIADGSGTFTVGSNAKSFTDTAGHWSEEHISFVTARELFLGVSENEFAPNNSMTRGMLATVLGRLLGVEESRAGSGGFTDVNAEAYYAPYIAYASEHGIVNGLGNGQFAPNREVTREEMATMVARFMEHAQIQAGTLNSYAGFEDDGAIAPWAAEAIQLLQEADILDGRPGNVFDPQGDVTRAEVAKVMQLMLEAYVY
ncbi:S-layer homology domain-containing protein [Alkalihalobacillus oceani]|uniref:LamG-like jellyroll fold domain-containing protein n=1 Tax=Halalkalibacter oceani TaxID=1653776 RepID=UPI00203B7D39|nr:LamG-like jellyroll fold domain-containing protein [Halalkalibacter oceani]MCM3761888.1 S-layer homology domain-containing protein [Halalkalibacter oceani]